MKTTFACSHCNKHHECEESIEVKVGGGILVYGVACVREMTREIDAMSKEEAEAELVTCTDELRILWLERRVAGVKSHARVRRRTEDVNLTLVKGGRG